MSLVVACSSVMARARDPRAGAFRLSRVRAVLGTVQLLSASPGTVSFNANNPNSGSVFGSSNATVSWTISAGSHLKNWTLSVQASSSSFSGCPTVPVSAVQVSCGSVSGGSGGTCSGSSSLSTSFQQVAGGTQADLAGTYSVSIDFTLAESWRYIANSSCNITLTYSVNAQ